MSDISFVTKNILEDATVTANFTPDTGFPLARVYDRQISLYCKKTSTINPSYTANQAAGVLSVDFLALHRHNFSGRDCQWRHSDDNMLYTNAVPSWIQADNEQIIKTLDTAIDHQYWMFFAALVLNPYCGEVWMGERWTHEVLAKPAPEAADIANVTWQRTTGGLLRSTKFGDVRRSRVYEMALSEADLTSFQAAMEDLDNYSLPFWFCDHAENWFLAKFSEVPREIYSTKTHTWVGVAVEELL